MSTRTLLALLPLLLAGCVPEAIVWNGDGSKALVSTGQATYLVNPEGKSVLVAEFAGHITERPFSLTPAVWVPNSSSFLLVESKTFPTWKELSKELGAEESKRIEALAKKLKLDSAQYVGPVNEFKSNQNATRPDLLAAWICWRDQWPDELGAFFERNKEQSPQDFSRQASAWKAMKTIVRLFDVNDMSASAGRVVQETFGALPSLRVSPDGKSWARVEEYGPFALPDFGGLLTNIAGATQLVVQSLAEGSEPLVVAKDVNDWPAWSLNSGSIYYMKGTRPNSPKEEIPSLGIVCRTDFASGPIGVSSIVGESTLYFASFRRFNRLAVLPDDEILLLSDEMQLPSTLRGAKIKSALFRFQSGKSETVTKVTLSESSEELDKALQLGSFAVNPRGDKLAVTLGDGRTGIVTLADGKIEWIQPQVIPKSQRDGVWEHTPPTAPAWRSNDEVTFAAPPNVPLTRTERTEIVLYSPAKTTVLTKSWEHGSF